MLYKYSKGGYELMNIVFDVDGTLTDSRAGMDRGFQREFLAWVGSSGHAVWLITGSDYPKTLEQVGSAICESVVGVYNCAGNQLHSGGVLQDQRSWSPSDELRAWLLMHLSTQPWAVKTGQHLEERVGLTNWSPVGRGCNRDTRAEFYAWDQQYRYRQELALRLEATFPELQATVAGETGIDIYPRGWDKSQIADRVMPFHFFGDSAFPGGNDETIARRAETVWEVKGWRNTQQVLIDHYGLVSRPQSD